MQKKHEYKNSTEYVTKHFSVLTLPTALPENPANPTNSLTPYTHELPQQDFPEELKEFGYAAALSQRWNKPLGTQTANQTAEESTAP